MKSLIERARTSTICAGAALLAMASLTGSPVRADALLEKRWIHGSRDCAQNRDPPLEIFEFDADTYLLRQNKCVHFEAPFIYVLFGEHTVFIQDTGATEDPAQFPLYKTIQHIIQRRGARDLKMLVTHSHSHGDHKAGDAQFRGKPGVTLVEPTGAGVREYFKFTDWPNGEAVVDLGGRKLIVQPAPGHQDEALIVYDPRTRWLLTGDSVYPGRLYVRDWQAFRASVDKMVKFAASHPVSAVMGTHIELSSTGEQYPAGTTYQPDEARLPMTKQDLIRLDELLEQAGDRPKEIVTQRFIVQPR
jgi:glyoxylase-like metal-dependent hydrolase (beta-lactamase superfamily II)